MTETQKLLTRLSAKYDGASDYKLAKLLEVSQGAISHYQNSRRQMGTKAAIKTADLLGENRLKVVASIKIESALSDETRQFWEDLLATNNITLGLVVAGFGAFWYMPVNAVSGF